MSHNMIKKLFYVVTILLCPYSGVMSEELCNLIGDTKNANGGTTIECTNFENLNGQTIVVPAQTSKLSKRQLALCELQGSLINTPDIIYILDQSDTMNSNWKNESPHGNSVITYNKMQTGIPEPVRDTTILWGTGTKKLPVRRPVNLKKLKVIPGDPFGQAPVALHKAIDYQAKTSPRSTAAFIGFRGDAVYTQQPIQMSNNTNIKTIKGKIIADYPDYRGDCAYYPPLKLAYDWFSDPTISKSHAKIVVFISDGRTSDVTRFQNFIRNLNPKMPQIYTIFIGERNSINHDNLQFLSDQTGGKFSVVPADQPDKIVKVIKDILDQVFVLPLKDVAITNHSVLPNQTSILKKSSLIQQSDNSWKIALDSSIALLSGKNSMSINIDSKGWGNTTVSSKFNFTIDVTTSSNVSENSLTTECFSRANFKVKNSKNVIVDTLTDKDKQCNLLLDLYEHLDINRYDIKMVSKVYNDTEYISISDNDIHGTNPSLKRTIIAKGFQFLSSDVIKATVGNNRLEAGAEDMVYFYWTHPRDKRDYALDSVVVKGVSLTFNPTLATIHDRNEDGRADELLITYHRKLKSSFDIQEVFWNQRGVPYTKTNIPGNVIDSATVQYSFTGNEFPAGLTGVPTNITQQNIPMVTVKDNPPYIVPNRTIKVTDKIGPVPVHARLYASDPDSITPDTLSLTISEPIAQNITPLWWNFFVKGYAGAVDLSSPISGYDVASTISAYQNLQPAVSPEGLVYTYLVNKNNPLLTKGSYVFLNADGQFKDINQNKASRTRVSLERYEKLYFTRHDDITARIKKATWPQDKAAKVVLNGESLTANVDKLTVTLTSPSGDKEVFEMTETTPTSGLFVGDVKINFVKVNASGNGILECTYTDNDNIKTDIIGASLVHPTGKIFMGDLSYKYNRLTRIFIKNDAGIETKLLTHLNKKPKLCVDVYKKTALQNYTINLNMIDHHDKEKIFLSQADIVPSTDTNRILFEKEFDFISNDTLHPTVSNDIVECSADDTIVASWVHPQDPAQTSSNTTYVEGIPIIFDPLVAAAIDSDGNGAVDKIRITFDKNVPKEFVMSYAFWNNREEAHKRGAVQGKITDQKNVLEYSFNVQEFPPLMTQINPDTPDSLLPYFKFAYEDFYNIGKDSLSVVDSVAPVIISAEFYPKFKDSDLSDAKDSMVVTFSEPVNKTLTSSPFILFDIVKKNIASMDVQSFDGGSDIQTYRVLRSDKEFPQNGDSLRINEDEGVIDLLGNAQKVQTNRYVPLKVHPYKFDILPLGCPNPWPINLPTVRAGRNLGYNMLLDLKIINGGVPHQEYTSKISLYDPLGNVILKNEEGKVTQDKKHIEYLLSNRKKNGRKLGPSDYLCVINVQNSDGHTVQKKFLIGVKLQKAK